EHAKNREALLLATADRASLEEHAPELLSRRGGLSRVHLHEVAQDSAEEEPTNADPSADAGRPTAPSILADAFRRTDAGERLALCVDALGYGRTPATL